MIQFAQRDSVEQVELGLALAPKFDADGLLPAIVIDAANQQVLMLGYMNADALEKTISTRLAHFWSRSRQSLWRKGEHSGFAQRVDRMLIDDDQDAVILYVAVDGPGSCHVGFTSCFYRAVDLAGGETRSVALAMIEDAPAFDAAAVYDGLANPTRL
ncbi:phosphoribosyl-AMP cyclohydrolase [Sphingorhabdus sp.]|jgi:phosphoribosyl-AMP cyclohydrolase|uniref:phosphoribosyl-AMP cyclohydrolase n=1 Tax=Sphingorhabdus sp. TaxID=1902408 RepID=UPI003D8190DC